MHGNAPVMALRHRQYAPDKDHSPVLDATDCTHIQEVIGVLLYYAHAVDATMLPSLGTLATQQSKGTHATMVALTQLLNYCVSHPNANIHYTASNMVLWTHSDASYLMAPKARPWAAIYSFLSQHPPHFPTASDAPLPNNGPVHVLCQIMRQVVASAAEAELSALFLNAQSICPLQTALEDLGHTQPAMPLQTDNNKASGIINDMAGQAKTIQSN